MMKNFLKYFFVFFYSSLLFGQYRTFLQDKSVNKVYGQYYQIKKYSTEDGLLNNEIYKVTQDKAGLLWISNGKGFSAFDGKTFKNFIKQKDLSPESEIIEKDNFLYSNFNEGIVKFNYFNLSTKKVDNSLIRIYDAEKGGFRTNKFLMDKDGYSVLIKHPFGKKSIDTICFSQYESKLNYLTFSLEKKDSFSLSIINDNKNVIWFIAKYKDKKTGNKLMSLYYFDHGKIILFMSDQPFFSFNKLFYTSKDEVYLVSNNKFVRISKNKQVTSTNFKYNSQNCPRLVEDSKGILWAGYYKGLMKITDTSVIYIENANRSITPVKTPEFDENGEMEMIDRYEDYNYLEHITIDSKDNIVSANEIYDGKTFTRINVEYELISNLFIDNQDQIWYSSMTGLFCAKKQQIKQLNLNYNICFVSQSGTKIITYNSFDGKSEMLYLYNNFQLIDSVLIKINGYGDRTIHETKKAILIISKGGVYSIINNKFQLQKLQLNIPKTKVISFNSDGSNEIPPKNEYAPKTLFCDEQDCLWGLTGSIGYLFKTDGINYWYYGKEDGISDTIFSLGRLNKKASNYFFTTTGIYYFLNDKFHLVKNSNKRFSGVRLMGRKENDFYFQQIIYSKTKESKVFSINNNVLQEYSYTNKDNSNFTDNFFNYLDYKKGFLSVMINKGFTKQTINKEHKLVENSFFTIDPSFIPQAPSFHYLNNKLIVFDDAGPIQIYDIKNIKSDSFPKPILLRDFANFTDLSYDDSLGNIFATNIEGKSIVINSKDNFSNEYIPKTYFLKLTYTAHDTLNSVNDFNTTISLPYNFTPLSIYYKAVCLTDGKKLLYKYKLTGIDKNWNETKEDNVVYSTLPAGTYTFEVKACNNDGLWDTEPSQIVIHVLAPWYKTWWAYIFYGLIGLTGIVLYIKSRTRILEKEKQKLEKIVDDRTAEITQQKHFIEEKNKEITDSINYAQKIQSTLMASESYLDEHLKKDGRDYFIFYQPKDIVSGDYFWAYEPEHEKNNFILITADCTGHGVPGAFMSLLCVSYLNEIVKEQGITQPNLIFNNVRDKIVANFKVNENPERKDGMDAVLCKFNFDNNELIYSAGNNPIIILELNEEGKYEIKELPYDKMPVGVTHDGNYTSFTDYNYKLKKHSLVYTFTDGFADQFGGPKGKKFMYKQLRQILLENCELPMAMQKEKLHDAINQWMGNIEQVDDICLIGIKI